MKAGRGRVGRRFAYAAAGLEVIRRPGGRGGDLLCAAQARSGRSVGPPVGIRFEWRAGLKEAPEGRVRPMDG